MKSEYEWHKQASCSVNGSIDFFIARQHTDARYWYCNSVCRPYVRCSGILWKRLNILS